MRERLSDEMARPRADWVATLRYGDRVVGERRIPEDGRLWVGDGGDLAIPGVAGRVALVMGSRLCAVPGLQAEREIPSRPGEDEVVTLTVAAHPAVTLAVTRERRQDHGFRRGLLRAPIMELAYGMGAAACVAALLGLAATTLDDRRLEDQHDETQQRDESSPIVLAMLETPKVAFVALPPPVVRDDDDDDGAGIGGDEDSPEVLPTAAPPDLVLEQLELDAEPSRPARAIVREPEAPPRAVWAEPDPGASDMAVASLLGSDDADFAVLSALSDDIDDELDALMEGRESSLVAVSSAGVRGGVTGGVVGGGIVDLVDEAVEPHDRGGGVVVDIADEGPSGVSGGVPGGVPGGVVGGVPAATDGVGLRKVECDPVPAPKPQVDVVFVLDVSPGMIDALASISVQISALDDEARKYDASPRYGLVAFVDDVKLVGGREGFASAAALERAIDDLLARAGMGRQLDGQQTNGEVQDNGLDALHVAATQFGWRDAADTLRLVVYASSADAADEGTVLSGGTVAHGYAAVQRTLADRSIRVASFTDPAGASGFSAPRGGRSSIPKRTRGDAFDLARLASGRLALRSALEALLSNPECTDGAAAP